MATTKKTGAKTAAKSKTGKMPGVFICLETVPDGSF